MTNISALPSDSLVKARTSCVMQAAFVQQALKYLHERLLFVIVAYYFSCFTVVCSYQSFSLCIRVELSCNSIDRHCHYIVCSLVYLQVSFFCVFLLAYVVIFMYFWS